MEVNVEGHQRPNVERRLGFDLKAKEPLKAEGLLSVCLCVCCSECRVDGRNPRQGVKYKDGW